MLCEPGRSHIRGSPNGRQIAREGIAGRREKASAMPDPCAQRTLVKSPPELWAEISDAGALARHLGEFGEIRITRLEAETTVVWEGDRARGTVELEPSGWGTKVTITAQPADDPAPDAPPAPIADVPPTPTADPPPAPTADAPAVPTADAPPAPTADTPAADEPAAEEPPAPEPALEPLSVGPPTPAATTLDPLPEKKPGFFARLFGRRKNAGAEPPALVEEPAPVEEPTPELPAAVDVVEEPVVEEPVVEVPVVTEPVVAEEPPAPEPFGPDRIEAVLVGVLDDLGSAHHRPFSRG
jgi:hypothetical protein